MSYDRPWFREYEQFGIPETLAPYPDEPVHSLLEQAAERYPAQGLVQFGQQYTFPEVLDHVERLATALRDRGVEKGSRVATILPTSAQFVIADKAISRAGGVHIPNDFLDAEEDLVYRLERGDPEVLIGQDKHRELVLSLRDELGLDDVILTDIEDYSQDPPVTHDEVPGVEWLPEVIAETDPNPPDLDFDVDEDVHTLLFTGGTTGLPKGCMLTHKNVLTNAYQGVASQSQMANMMRGEESAVMALPMYHSYGYSVTNVLLELGVNLLVVPDARDTDQMVEYIQEWQAIIMLGVPTQFMEIVKGELDTDVIGISGSAPLADETKRQFEEKSKGVSQGYGLSEMSPITTFNTRGLQDMLLGRDTREDGFDKPTIGVPVPDTEIKLVDVDSGEVIPLDEAVAEEREGELYVNGPQRMKGYLDESKNPFDDEGYVSTGDIAMLDSWGRLYIVDRVKHMINVSGLKVYSEELDEILFGHPAVERPATVGVPDPERPGSERVKVFVELDEAYDGTVEAGDIVEFLDGKVAAHAVPSEVEFVDELPLTDIGKTDKKALKERAA
ncbi:MULTISPECIES: AMP-binding protein [unclassified Haladaptatus]|uniref:AMP-binding protein n=1 Tax=unclassified Haladaptatus TaxID=2622732 RepID=UPI0023E8DE3E|nr:MULTISPECIES: class I adenylate-forming enzyme family protein [unclassified Haladaptatus]